MESKTKRNKVDELSLDVLLGIKPVFREPRKVGRLPQLNKRMRIARRYYEEGTTGS